MKLIDYPDQDMMMLDLADRIASELVMTLEHEERASLAVPGGATPGPVFDALCAADLDWARVDVMLTDERWVPETHPRSNTAMLRDRLLTSRAARANLVPLYHAGATPEQVIAQISDRVENCLPLSVAVLGMGEDMHTASLFPGGDQLAQALSREAPAALTMNAPGAEEPRVTLSARALNSAVNKHLIITGQAKRDALAQAMEAEDALDAPIKALLGALNVHWAA
ncbi:6-phosphogluconolactonase [Aliiroseovarius crassostreae]|uniref:6-phosphogluconolactonase n=1 Tax=Aliiroseovarius crassostreae TaxID=154981 RepID=UPI0021AE7D91|nr:6-phosphogluconolactonase [Aliiroseovarius crassostreae]UWQ06700.1 6-phosphogluconolactonase [Aliiroseovarius crassostreae]UWQ12482.1 6-phosphogluconolactonase [Aliiroseovarius crassostreae]